MSWGLSLLSLLLCATFIVVAVAVIRFGWPTLRWRTYNEVHGDLRIIEIGVMMSGARTASGYAFGSFRVPARLLQGISEAWRGRPARSRTPPRPPRTRLGAPAELPPRGFTLPAAVPWHARRRCLRGPPNASSTLPSRSVIINFRGRQKVGSARRLRDGAMFKYLVGAP